MALDFVTVHWAQIEQEAADVLSTFPTAGSARFEIQDDSSIIAVTVSKKQTLNAPKGDKLDAFHT